jgi:energy-coupling factor transporter transmembrane protein EcfT
MESLFGTMTMVLAISMVVIALPSQIVKNSREKKCGLSMWMVLLPLAVYMSRTCYAMQIKSWYIVVPDVLGVIFSIIIFVQFFVYKQKTSKEKEK